MRGIKLKKGPRTTYPWGPESTVNGARFKEAAAEFNRGGAAFGQAYDGETILERGREIAPEWFERRELTAGEVVERFNLGGRHPSLGENKFKLQWFPQQRMWQAVEPAELVDLIDHARLMGEAARRTQGRMDLILQMASTAIKQLPQEEQDRIVEVYEEQKEELEQIEDWGSDKRLTLASSIAKHQLDNGNGGFPPKKK